MLGAAFVEAAPLVPVTVGLTQVVKYALPGVNWSRWGPCLSVFVGSVLTVWLEQVNGDAIQGLLHAMVIGAVVGLSASGLYDLGARSVFHRKGNGKDGN